MNLVFLINDKNNYARHLGATLMSVLLNTREKWKIYVIYTVLSEENMIKITSLVKEKKCEVEYIKITEKLLDKFSVGKGTHLDIIVFGRLYIPEILKNEKKAIYLDCDIIVKSPLEELYNINLDEYSILAIPDSVKDQELNKKRLKLSKEKIYFNAGVMVMDLDKLRENKLFEKTAYFCNSNKEELLLNEQDALNIIFENNFKCGGIEWNYTHGNCEDNKISKEKINIIHYTGEVKPWDCADYSPYKKEYWKYINKTPWRGVKEEGRSFKVVLLRIITILKLKTRKYRYKIKNK
ncbi:MAG: glycosyltransferase family 8 protein [Fusobacteriaceae bacterium]